MKIGINVSYASSEKPTGIGNYIINLVKALLSYDNKNQYNYNHSSDIHIIYKIPL